MNVVIIPASDNSAFVFLDKAGVQWCHFAGLARPVPIQLTVINNRGQVQVKRYADLPDEVKSRIPDWAVNFYKFDDRSDAQSFVNKFLK